MISEQFGQCHVDTSIECVLLMTMIHGHDVRVVKMYKT